MERSTIKCQANIVDFNPVRVNTSITVGLSLLSLCKKMGKILGQKNFSRLFLWAQRDESDGHIIMLQSLFEPCIKQLLSATETGLVANIVPR